MTEINDSPSWDEEDEQTPREENVFLQDILEPQFTTQMPINDDTTEQNFKDFPKPSPRYGHAACKYEGKFYFKSFKFIKLSIKQY